jgi:hypothetical protein
VSTLFLFFLPVVPCVRADPPLPPSFHPHSCRSDVSLGARWAFSFQQVLLPENRPWLPGLDLAAVT